MMSAGRADLERIARNLGITRLANFTNAGLRREITRVRQARTPQTRSLGKRPKS